MFKLQKIKIWSMIFIAMFCFITIHLYIEKHKNDLKFSLGFSFILTIIFIIVDYTYPDTIKSTKPTNIIISRPPQWVYTYDALENQLHDDLIRIVIGYQFIGEEHLDFNIYRKAK